MEKFIEQKFNIGELKGISKKTIEEHIKLYQGYVKHANLILSHIAELGQNPDKYTYEIGELRRRFSFEYGGIRNHELYFSSLEDGPKPLSKESSLRQAISAEWGNFEKWLTDFKMTALTRGIGWAILYYDKKTDGLLIGWTDEQHLGHLIGAKPILALDMWEHSYVMDYAPSGKKNYVEDFLANLNWQSVEANFAKAK